MPAVLRRLYAAPDGSGEVLATTASGEVALLRRESSGGGSDGVPRLVRVPQSYTPLTSSADEEDESDNSSGGERCRTRGVLLPFPAVDLRWCPFKAGAEHRVFLSACRSQPLQLWDADDGELRAAYTATAANGAASSPSAAHWRPAGAPSAHLVGGYGGPEEPTHVRTFDLLACAAAAVWSHDSRLAHGAVACLGEGPRGLLLAGYRDAPVVEALDERSRCPALALRAPLAGVLAIASAGDVVCTAGRRGDDAVYCWDVRRPAAPLAALRRPLRSHQRCDMVLSPSGDLVSASTAGGVFVFPDIANMAGAESSSSGGRQLHRDVGCTSGVALLGPKEVAVVVGARAYQPFPRPSPPPPPGCSFNDAESPVFGSKRPRSPVSTRDDDSSDDASGGAGARPSSAGELNVRVLQL